MRRPHNYAPHGRYGDGGKVRTPRSYEATDKPVDDAVRAARKYFSGIRNPHPVQPHLIPKERDPDTASYRNGGKVKGK